MDKNDEKKLGRNVTKCNITTHKTDYQTIDSYKQHYYSFKNLPRKQEKLKLFYIIDNNP